MNCKVIINEYVYALDIGTRNVVGVIATYEDDRLKVLQSHSMKHPQRAMYDGQIHEIGCCKSYQKDDRYFARYVWI